MESKSVVSARHLPIGVTTLSEITPARNVCRYLTVRQEPSADGSEVSALEWQCMIAASLDGTVRSGRPGYGGPRLM
jgi:hypothetical protein